MQKIILDTNIVVSALINNSFPHYVIKELVVTRQVLTCLSEKLLKEYVDVLSRSKFLKIKNFANKANNLLQFFINNALFYEPNIKLTLIKDEADNRLLELADASEADFLITGNTKDFEMPYYKNTKILTPRNFWEMKTEELQKHY